MKSDENWKESRLLAQDLELIAGVPVEVTEDYLKIIENLIIHKFVEILSNEDFRGKDCQVELPYLGSLVVSVDEKNKMSTNFVVRNSFYRKLRKAYLHRESPLVEQCSSILGDHLVELFEKGDITTDE